MANENNSRASTLGLFSTPKPQASTHKMLSPAEIAGYCHEGLNDAEKMKGPIEKIIAMRPNTSNVEALRRVDMMSGAFLTAANNLKTLESQEHLVHKEEETHSSGLGYNR
ncbi:hypothetical protein DIZ81_06175 [Legionella taurinensis]|uniref:Uncharacterized protein n=1 Tax=Legionella taurinensis TaxID=70611 RepID=A0A3A5L915_9GAMM|nr:hypothetical protein [Legionella taurinensis]MDX1837504.1 hypothetical protein [Legionella taurinensis]PUT40845.1 hypothetical protein DB744_06175 [Legionella taurinensis]PUT44266.1 hypothetical protein DB746_04575 [Legionella taurinensis]PUT47568.1 hypothetical protein DB743_02745 [Legionella taurinensis]PUT48707.1 hypothetical protein DB745_04575 [Legionella taurinensis]